LRLPSRRVRAGRGMAAKHPAWWLRFRSSRVPAEAHCRHFTLIPRKGWLSSIASSSLYCNIFRIAFD
jgi:hypothetical protein